MSTLEQIYEWIKEGESETLDFKQSISDPAKIAKTLVAFANKSGGLIVDGVSDFGEIIGIDISQEKYILEKSAKEYCNPRIQLRYDTWNIHGSKVLLVEVQESDRKYHSAGNEDDEWKVYVRKNDRCALKTELHKYDMEYNSSNTPITIYSSDNTGLMSYLDKRDIINVGEYMELMKIPYEVARRSLDHLVKSNILIFQPGRKNPHYRLRRN